MRKYIYAIIISSLIVSCGGGGGDTPPDPPVETNKAPSIPTLSYPTNNLLCIDNSVAFQWNASIDPEGNPITYQIQVAKDNLFTQIAHTLTSSTATKTIALEKGVAYYWRVKATDSKNAASDYSTSFQFYTEGEGQSNHLPFSPTVVAPTINEVIQTDTATLSWTASDTDNDPLTFDVYFGTVNPPIQKIAENQSETTKDVSLESSKTDYWKVVVKDDKDGITIGQVWTFKTD